VWISIRNMKRVRQKAVKRNTKARRRRTNDARDGLNAAAVRLVEPLLVDPNPFRKIRSEVGKVVPVVIVGQPRREAMGGGHPHAVKALTRVTIVPCHRCDRPEDLG
jgi:hypothetical protein